MEQEKRGESKKVAAEGSGGGSGSCHNTANFLLDTGAKFSI